MPKVHNGADSGSSRGRGRRVSTSLAEINVVPLVDVMLVLLIIFMVTAPMLQRGIDVKLPQSSRAVPVSALRVDVTVPADYRTTRMLYVGKQLVRADNVREIVRQRMEKADRKEVSLRGDATVQYQDLMEVFDSLK